MAKFGRSRERSSRSDSRDSFPKRENKSRTFEESHNRRDRGDRRFSGRESSRNSRNRRDFEMTKVICSSCGEECEVPFKPTTSKPVYCDACFAKKGKDSPNNPSNRDLEIINEKLNKIMRALDIE